MSGMRLDDYRAAHGQRRGRVAAANGEGEREVAGSEDGDGPERTQHGAKIGARERLTIGESWIDACLDPGAFLNDGSKETKLVGGTVDFAGETRDGKSRFKMRSLGEFVAVRLEAVGDPP